jgi:Nucleoside 2-deoxyribosyltransferase like
MARILKPPTPLPADLGPSVFLAGSIEMGQAPPWQTVLEKALADLDVLLLNPRREEWDAGWVQALANPVFREQVEWELTAQERATLIAMYFAPATRAPITLLELGLFARGGKVIVCCPEGFWRKGNVDVVCTRYGIPQVTDLPALGQMVRSQLEGLGG